MKNIISNEFKIFFRSKIFLYLTIFFTLSLITVVWLGVLQTNNQNINRDQAQKHIREKWENLEAMNPHQAAHYGSYAFKPISSLNSIDSGINDITGNVLKLEGHIQNEIVYSEASQSLSISKFGKLKSALLLQYVIPLFLIFLAFSTITSEKETLRLKLLIFQGISLKSIIFAKSFSIWIYGIFLLLFTLLIQSFFITVSFDIFQRLLLIFFSYGLYYYIIISLATFFSAFFKSKSSSLSTILSLWILWTIFIPKIWGNAVEKIYTLPSRQEFKMGMKEDRSKGIDGHNPYDQRRETLKNKFLAEYGVDSLSQLPINFDGIVMQEDEEYGNFVWDKYFGDNYKILKRQKVLYQVSGLLNPFASLQSASMGFCGTDMIHHLDFLKKAEDYRRFLIKELNDEHAYGGSKTGDWSWTVDSTFFKSVSGFHFKTPKISNYIEHYKLDIFSLIFWTFLITFINSNKKLHESILYNI